MDNVPLPPAFPIAEDALGVYREMPLGLALVTARERLYAWDPADPTYLTERPVLLRLCQAAEHWMFLYGN